ncbi:MAG: tRNA (adenosine(37)-N6)-dimethylallyltransferase MiaA [Elusimicrobia bacterium]|nr:tRNA (adenosine(37)-N6)-dimethylallyltransferase MiaA [Elusimicrobiota bacterium]
MIIAIVGPTASGKSGVAVVLAKKLNAEIISFDSRQVYKYLNIGTAKPTASQLRQIKHHLISICHPDEEFNAGTFVKLASDRIRILEKKGKNVILVGGTGLYLKALLEGLCPAPPANKRLRRELEAKAKKYGKMYLYKRLAKIDPKAAAKIHPNNRPRLIRALEIFYQTGKPFSQLHQQTVPPRYKAKIIGISCDRQTLYKRIDRRVDEMFRKGLVREVCSLIMRGYGPELKPMQSLGYRQVCQYLAGKITLPAALVQTKLDTRHYAKRQLSWFRPNKEIRWFPVKYNLDNKTLLSMVRYAKL